MPVIYATYLLLALTSQNGQHCHVLSLVFLSFALVVDAIFRPSFFRLRMAWQLGYLVVVAREGYFDVHHVVSWWGQNAYDTASRYVTAGNAALLLGYSIVFRERRSQRHVESAQHGVQDTDVRYQATPLCLAVCGGLYAAFLAFVGPGVYRQFLMGRAEFYDSLPYDAVRVSSVADVVMNGLSSSLGICIPAVTAFLVRFVYRRPSWWALLWSLPALLVVYMTGIRFQLLLASAGLMVVLISNSKIRVTTLIRLGLAALLVFKASEWMVAFRTFGFEAFQSAGGEDWNDEDVVLGHYEAVMFYLAGLVRYFESHDFMNGSSVGVVLLFWVPRALWPGKPELLGYWMPRALGIKGYASGYSASASFAGDPYADFGYYGGILFLLGAGLLLGLLERWCTYQTTVRHPTVRLVLVGPLYGAAYFAARSPETATIAMSGVAACTLVFRALLTKTHAVAEFTVPSADAHTAFAQVTTPMHLR